MKKYIKLLCSVVAIYAAIVFSCESMLLSVKEYETVHCAFGEAESVVVCTGEINDLNASTVDIDHPAYFSEVMVSPGDEVSAGDVLAKIDIDRTVSLLERLDAEAIAEMLHALGITESLQAAIAGEIPELSKYSKTIDMLLESDGIIRSPRDGVVTEVTFVAEELITEETKIVVSDRSIMEINASVPAEYSRFLQIGNQAVVTSECFDDEIEATIINISPTTSDSGQVAFSLSFDNSYNGLKSGFPVSVKVITDRNTDALLLPFECVFEDGGDMGHVFICENGRAKKISVRLGVRSAEYTQILEGLTGREEIVLANDEELLDGQYIRITEGD